MGRTIITNMILVNSRQNQNAMCHMRCHVKLVLGGIRVRIRGCNILPAYLTHCTECGKKIYTIDDMREVIDAGNEVHFYHEKCYIEFLRDFKSRE